MDLLALTLLATACCSLYLYIKKFSNYFRDAGIPYVPFVPFLGSMAPVILRKKHISTVLKEIYNHHPNAKYIGAFDFVRPTIVLRDPELIKNITMKHFEHFMDHDKNTQEDYDYLTSKNIFNLTGDKWREARALVTPAFTSNKMKIMFDLIVPCAENLTNHLSDVVRNLKDAQNMKALFTMYTTNVIVTCVFGININTFKDPKNDFYVLGKKATNLNGLRLVKYLLSKAFPRLKKVVGAKIVSDDVRDFFMELVRTTVAKRDRMGIKRPDMIQLLMDARGKSMKYFKLDTKEMTANAFAFFFTSFETLSTQMCIITQELALNPDIQTRLQAEIDQVAGKTEGKPSFEDIQGMEYLEAVIKESIRKHSIAIVLSRICTREYKLPPALPDLKPFTVSPGMHIWIPISGIQHDEKYYENPGKFDPDRHFKKHPEASQAEFLSFGAGPRKCIGIRFAIMHLKTTLFHVLSKFAMRTDAKTCMDFEYNVKCRTIEPKGGYWLRVERRK